MSQKIYLNNISDTSYINYLVKFLELKIKDKVKNTNTKKMDDYLKSNYNIEIKNVVDNILNIIEYKKINDSLYTMSYNDKIIEPISKINYSSLIKLIDEGNLEVKGLNIFNMSLLFINKNWRELYLTYLFKGEKYNGN